MELLRIFEIIFLMWAFLILIICSAWLVSIAYEKHKEEQQYTKRNRINEEYQLPYAFTIEELEERGYEIREIKELAQIKARREGTNGTRNDSDKS